MVMKKLLRNAASVCAASLICGIGFASAAWAGTDGLSETDGASVRFISYGDKFTVCDTKRDGAAAYNDYFWYDNMGDHRDVNPGSAGSCHTFNHDFPENEAVSFRACEDQPLYPDDCDSWVNRIA
ncbi:hypothetical protein EES47_13755 [Streptomyces sp. ADI98-12]|jgi:hypothetical protein|uniref:Secreted protein n=2 Tax=Streptomyces TaxID=1883 RepID=A0A380N723_STRGR|nr:hypothetical protein EES47_13755 [Streptomyces sp. ADI98-12]GFH75250.1 hypothetical protein Sdia_60180 [Streptomyces diastaticus subsp. diastaticus]GGU44379.1 hypothetical protein GCM10015534_53740 [Streptomyces diastaticus subsp. diastaticus]SUP27314.1 Uncharacterised protein [Streptomyces griseus]